VVDREREDLTQPRDGLIDAVRAEHAFTGFRLAIGVDFADADLIDAQAAEYRDQVKLDRPGVVLDRAGALARRPRTR
jgi:hypothetical protein